MGTSMSSSMMSLKSARPTVATVNCWRRRTVGSLTEGKHECTGVGSGGGDGGALAAAELARPRLLDSDSAAATDATSNASMAWDLPTRTLSPHVK